MSAKKSTPSTDGGFKRVQDKLLGWLAVALVGFVIWLYLQDRTEWREFMQEQRTKNADIDRRMELAIERHGRMREDITTQNERISRLWERYSEIRDGNK